MPVSTYQRLSNFNPSRGDTERAGGGVKPGRALLRITRPDSGEYHWISKGRDGSIQTAFQMARLVREDTVRDIGLQKFAADIVTNAGLDSHSPKKDILKAVFDYAQSATKYISDPAGSFESIQNARQTLATGIGDCDDLSVLLATLLAQVGFQPRFVLARYNPQTIGYDHVYIDVELPNGERFVLDPSSRTHFAGWESSKAIERLTYPIFAFPMKGLGNPQVTGMIVQGAQAGLSFVPVVGNILSSLVGPIAGLFNRTQQRSEEAARDEWRDQVYNAMAQVSQAVDSCQITPEQGTQAANELITQYYSMCDTFTKKSVTKSCHNYGTEAAAFPLRLSRIASGGASCAAKAAVMTTDPVTGITTTTPGTAASGAGLLSGSVSVGGASISVTTLLLLGVGGVMAWKFLK